MYPPAQCTGNASGYVVDANFEYLVGVKVSFSPADGPGVVYLGLDNLPSASQAGTPEEGWFLVGGMSAGTSVEAAVRTASNLTDCRTTA